MRRSLNLTSKRANVFTDTFMIVISIIVFAMVAYNGMAIYNDLNADIQGDASMGATAKTASGSLYNKYGATMDGAFLTIFILLWVLVIVASFLIDAHPIFFMISILLLFFVIYVSAILSNFFGEFIDGADLLAYQSSFPYTNFIIANIVWFVIGIGASVAIVLYGKVALLNN